MLYDILIFIPFFACLFWILTTCWVASKTSTFYPVLTTLFVMMLYVFTDCCYASPNIPPRMLVYSSIMAEFSAPSLIPLIWIYQLRLRGQEHFQPSQMLWLLLPSMLGFLTLMLTVLAGPAKIQEFQTMIYAGGFSLDIPADETVLIAYYFVTTWLFRGVLVTEALVYVFLDIRLMRKQNLRMRHLNKLFHGERVRVLELQVFTTLLVFISFIPKMFMTHSFLMSHPWVSAVLAIWIAAGICIFCFFSFFGSQERISIREMHSVMRYNYNRTNKARIVEQMLNDLVEEADDEVLWRLSDRLNRDINPDERPGAAPIELPKSLTSNLFSAVSKSWDDDSLLSRFEQLMLHGQAFLEPGLTLGDVAERLHSNKTYVSRLVNNTYNMAFPDLINTLRVDYAEQYIVLHRNARQNEIASACGFTSASSFNNIFKKVTGMTPKIWLATVDHQGHGPVSAPEVLQPAQEDE
ncbi:MAG: helix-turn-helix transcriptional regulator [Bacteroidales bacterium]|nr:helix-turn-helix transcriptional regulator [Bacteroidales bacterium]